MMKVSIITCCYNRVGTIEYAIRSVVSQNYPEIEYIIVDAASKDGTKDVVTRFVAETETEEFRRVHSCFSVKYVSESDHGMYEGLNKGIRMATGDIIGIVHSDDFLYNDHVISNVVEAFEKNKADFVYGDGLFVDENDTNKPVRNWIGGRYLKRKVKFGWLPLHPTCYIKREAMMRVGLYNEEYKIAADTDFLVRALYEHDLNVFYLPQYLVRMRMGGMSTDSSKRRRMWQEDIEIYRSHGFWAVPTKIMKMMWKVPQFVSAKLKIR